MMLNPKNGISWFSQGKKITADGEPSLWQELLKMGVSVATLRALDDGELADLLEGLRAFER